MMKKALAVFFLALLSSHAVAGTSVSTVATIEAGSGGIEVAADGMIYSSDFGPFLGNSPVTGTKVWKITPDGETSVFAEGFAGASGSAMAEDGTFFQANIRGNRISRIATDGTVSTYATEGLFNPVGLVLDPKGVLWVANCGAGSIQRIASDGSSTLFVKSDLLKCPNGLTRDPDGNLYAANFYNGDVVRIAPDATVSVVASLPGKNNGHLVYHDKHLYVVDRAGHRIFKVAMDGTFEPFAGSGEKGGADGAASEASFCFPNDIAVSADGKHFYVNDVADETSNGRKLGPTRIRRISVE